MKNTIKRGNLTGITETYGGELVSFKDKNGTEYVWTGDENHWTGHAPVLFPIVSALKNSKTIIDGVEYTIPKHGFARKSEFTLADYKEDEAVFELCQNEKTLEMYPYKFKLFISHKILENGFSTVYTIENTDTKDIKFFIGGHPGFNIPLDKNGKFEDYRLVFPQIENCLTTYCDQDSLIRDEFVLPIMKNTDTYNFDYNDFDIDVFILQNLKSRSLKVLDKNNKGFEFNFDGFEILGVWSPPKKHSPFICLEPWVGLPSNINESGKIEDKAFMVTLKQGKKYSVGYSIGII